MTSAASTNGDAVRDPAAARVELPPPGEVAGEKRQHEETGVPHQPGGFLAWVVSSEARDLDRDRRSHSEGERLGPSDCPACRLRIASDKELLPESAAVLSRELPGQAVDVPEPFHGDQESFVGREAGRLELGHLVAKVILQLLDVVAVDARGPCDIRPPICDL